MARLVADSGVNKGQFGTLVEALNTDLRAHDYEVLEKIAQITCLQGEMLACGIILLYMQIWYLVGEWWNEKSPEHDVSEPKSL